MGINKPSMDINGWWWYTIYDRIGKDDQHRYVNHGQTVHQFMAKWFPIISHMLRYVLIQAWNKKKVEIVYPHL